MIQKKAIDVKEGDIIIVFGEKATVKRTETSGKGIKQGKVKCRIETEAVKDKKHLTIIRLAEDLIEVE